jgi:hypothetical protein
VKKIPAGCFANELSRICAAPESLQTQGSSQSQTGLLVIARDERLNLYAGICMYAGMLNDEFTIHERVGHQNVLSLRVLRQTEADWQHV